MRAACLGPVADVGCGPGRATAHPVSCEAHLLPAERTAEPLGEAGLAVTARLVREPDGKAKIPSAYALARKPDQPRPDRSARSHNAASAALTASGCCTCG